MIHTILTLNVTEGMNLQIQTGGKVTVTGGTEVTLVEIDL